MPMRRRLTCQCAWSRDLAVLSPAPAASDQPPNQRLQRSGAPGLTVEWLAREAEVMQVLCGWRGVARR